MSQITATAARPAELAPVVATLDAQAGKDYADRDRFEVVVRNAFRGLETYTGRPVLTGWPYNAVGLRARVNQRGLPIPFADGANRIVSVTNLTTKQALYVDEPAA